MNKKELGRALAARTNITQKDAAEIVDALFNAETGLIVETLTGGDQVNVQGFGVFRLGRRDAYTARNPSTGGTIDLPERRFVKFAPGAVLKRTVR